MKFASFIDVMKKNWPQAHSEIHYMFPKMDKISVVMGRRIEQLMNEHGLLANDFHILTALRRSSDCPPFQLMPSELCEFMLFSWGGLAKMMKRLEENGFVTRVSNPADKRIRMIELTTEGIELIEKTSTQLHLYQQQFSSGLSSQEVIQLETLLSKVLDTVDSDSA